MTSMDKAAIAFSLAIVAIGVGFAFYMSDIQNAGPMVSDPLIPKTMETNAGTDPFASIADKVKENPSSNMNLSQEDLAAKQATEQMKKDTITFDEGLTTSTEKQEPITKKVEEESKKIEEKVSEDIKKLETTGTSDAVAVSIPEGTSVPGCETNNMCYVPEDVKVLLGGTVTWTNDDSAAHTVTSGTAASGPDGKFDSSLLMVGKEFQQTFDTKGIHDYFCMVHPWMVGTVQVE